MLLTNVEFLTLDWFTTLEMTTNFPEYLPLLIRATRPASTNLVKPYNKKKYFNNKQILININKFQI